MVAFHRILWQMYPEVYPLSAPLGSIDSSIQLPLDVEIENVRRIIAINQPSPHMDMARHKPHSTLHLIQRSPSVQRTKKSGLGVQHLGGNAGGRDARGREWAWAWAWASASMIYAALSTYLSCANADNASDKITHSWQEQRQKRIAAKNGTVGQGHGNVPVIT